VYESFRIFLGDSEFELLEVIESGQQTREWHEKNRKGLDALEIGGMVKLGPVWAEDERGTEHIVGEEYYLTSFGKEVYVEKKGGLTLFCFQVRKKAGHFLRCIFS